MSSRTRIAAVAVLAVSAVAFPGVARSAVVSSDGTTVTVTESAPGEANDITVSVDDPGTLRVYESFGPETPQGLCTYNAVTEIVECPLGPGGVQVSTGAGNDKVYSMLLGAGTLPDGAVVVDLGPGNDFFKGDAAGEKVSGGDGNDELNGWGGPDVLDGGAGDDKLDGEKGGDTLLGGDGNDVIDDDHYAEPAADVIDGGPGLDELEAYSPSDSDARNAPAINVTLGGGARRRQAGRGRRRAQRRAPRPGLRRDDRRRRRGQRDPAARDRRRQHRPGPRRQRPRASPATPTSTASTAALATTS